MHAGLHLRPLLPARGAAEIHKRSQGVWREQRHEATQRAPPPPARGRRQLLGLRGRGEGEGSGLRMRRRHLRAPETGPEAPEGARDRPCGPAPVRMRRDPDGASAAAAVGAALGELVPEIR